MNVSSPLRLKPLAACVAAALALAPAGVLLADPAHRPQEAKRSHVAQLLAQTRVQRGPTLSEVMQDAVARARATRPPPNRPAGTTAVTSCDDSGPGTLRDAVTNAVTGD